MSRTLLILLAGVLLGANLMYFLLHRDAAPARDVPDGAGRGVAQAPTGDPATEGGPAAETQGDTRSRSGPSGASASGTQASDDASSNASASSAPAVSGSVPGWPTDLRIPVEGVAPTALTNTYDDARGEGRRHDALDIMAARGTPVLAVADGRVEKLFDSERGGLTLYQFEPSGRFAYYYAHLDRYAAGIAEGQALRRGEVIGYVGSTGNAAEDAPHLHFAIFRLGREQRWWEGDPINPYPLLAPGAAATGGPR